MALVYAELREASDFDYDGDEDTNLIQTTNNDDINDKQIKLIDTHIKVCNELFYLESRVEEINNDLCRLISKLNNVNCLINNMRETLCNSI